MYYYYRDKKRIKSVWIESNDVKNVLEKYLGCKLRRDWINRLYGIFNPNIVNGKFDVNNIIVEFGDDVTSNEEQVKHKIYKQLMLIRQLFNLERLYDYTNIEITHVGKADEDNYLMVFSMTSQNELRRALKALFLHTLIYASVIGVTLVCIL